MPRPTATSVAQRSRDAGLSRLRRLTWYSGLGAAVLTALASLIAAETIPGHNQAAAAPSTASNSPSSDQGAGAPASGGQQVPPDQSQIQGGGGPVAVSGGS